MENKIESYYKKKKKTKRSSVNIHAKLQQKQDAKEMS